MNKVHVFINETPGRLITLGIRPLRCPLFRNGSAQDSGLSFSNARQFTDASLSPIECPSCPLVPLWPFFYCSFL